MEHTPEDYGAYWSAGLRLAAGALLVVVVFRGVDPLVRHPEWPAQALGWVVLGLSVVVGSFAVALGLAIIVRTAVAAEAR